MLETNVHVHVFTADHSPEIQFFYMLWNVFEGAFSRKGLLAVGPCRLVRFSTTSMAKASWRFRLVLWLGQHTPLGETFNDSVAGLVRIVRELSGMSEDTIKTALGMPGPVSGKAFLRFLRRKLERTRRWDEPQPFDRVLAEIAGDLYRLPRESPPSVPISQRELLLRFFGQGAEGGKARYQRVVLLPVDFDHAFRGMDKYGLAVAPAVSYAAQITDLEQLTQDPSFLAALAQVAQHPVELRPFLCVDPRHNVPGGLLGWVQGKVNLTSGPFYGVKLYPPMGFRPTDPRLLSVLEWCKAGAIPITAHCSQGGAGLRGLEERGDFAHPRHWRYLLDRLTGPGVLRLNLAHFSDLTRSLTSEAAQTWSDEIIRLMKYCGAHRSDVEIYSDLAYAWVGSDWKKLEQNVERLRDDGLGKWLLFGSDWWNYLPDCENEERYLENLHLGSGASGPFDPAELDENARWFLGLMGTGPRP